MGRLGWSQQQTMTADVNAVLMALEAQREWVEQIFGTGKKSPDKTPITADRFKQFSAKHNAIVKGKVSG